MRLLCVKEILLPTSKVDCAAAMPRFNVYETPLFGLKLIVRKVVGDERGFLSRLFCANELASVGWHKPVIQINHTLTKNRGAVRGMHFQKAPYTEMKLVSCLHGAVWDVAVDLRAGSPTFLHWHAEELSRDNRRALLIPEGFAHGFQSLTDNCELIYLHSSQYAVDSEEGFNPKDPGLNICWPQAITDLSARDRAHSLKVGSFQGVAI